MKKRIIRIAALVLILLIALLVALPSLMENRVGDLLKANLNNRIHGHFDFESMSLSLFRDFPRLAVSMNEVSLVNAEPFEGDTLFKASNVRIVLGIKELFQSVDDPIEIRELRIEASKTNLLVNDEGIANYDISNASKDGAAGESEQPNTVLSIRAYEISDSQLSYWDRIADFKLLIEDFNHRGSGDLSQKISSLHTSTDAIVSFSLDETKYLVQNALQLDSDIEIDLEQDLYSFKESKAVLNRLPLTLDGSVKLLEDGQDVDIEFQTVSSDFKNFLALIPEKYSKDISGIETKGNFDLSGHFQGVINETSIPQFSIRMNAKNAAFKYPELPKKVENIQIDAIVENTTGRSEDTSILIENAGFQIDEDIFEIQAVLSALTGNIGVRSHAKGSINLDKLSQAYPLPESAVLGGQLKGDINSSFRKEDIEKGNYKNIDLSGVLDIRGLEYKFEALPNPIKVHSCNAELSPKTIEIKELAGISGSTDFSATGTLRNTLGFLFNDEVLSGNFEMRSNAFVIADLIKDEQANTTTSVQDDPFEIPKFLDLNLDALVGKAVYDKIVMYDLAGKLRIRDEVISFSEISSRMLDGRLKLDGIVSTKDQKPRFDMTLDLTRLNISSAFESIELMSLLSPAAQLLDGRINSKISLSGALDNQLDLDLNSLSGNLLAEVLKAEIRPQSSKFGKLLDDKLGFVALDQLDLNGLKTALKFENGQVAVEPFDIRYQDINLRLSGGHSFAKVLDYQLTLDVPARLMGENVNKLLAGIGDESLDELTVPVIANVGGSYSDPKISTDLKAQTKALTDQLVEIQKQKYLNKGKEKLNDLIGGVLAGSSESDTDPNKKESPAENAADVLDKILPGQADSTPEVSDKEEDKNTLEKTAKSVLGGLLKSNSTKAKDTVN